MRELSLNILDICQNSITAKATLVIIDIKADTLKNFITIKISDNGTGIEKELLKNITSPFTTTRTTRRVGMGLPLFKMAAEITGGSFNIVSQVGKGTAVTGKFKLHSIDRMPMGELEETIITLIANNSGAEIVLNYKIDSKAFKFDTRAVKKTIQSNDLTDFQTLNFLKEYLKENIESTKGGTSL